MFRNMRRSGQELTLEENIAILKRGTSGVLAVCGDDGYPYAVPLSYVYTEGKIYFHCAMTGHKTDAIERNDKVSFCVVDQDKIAPQKLTTYYRSVIAFGTAHILQDQTAIRRALERLAIKYAPEYRKEREIEIAETIDHVRVIELDIEYMTGKQARELIGQ